jgi:hypothetical protein
MQGEEGAAGPWQGTAAGEDGTKDSADHVWTEEALKAESLRRLTAVWPALLRELEPMLAEIEASERRNRDP